MLKTALTAITLVVADSFLTNISTKSFVSRTAFIKVATALGKPAETVSVILVETIAPLTAIKIDSR